MRFRAPILAFLVLFVVVFVGLWSHARSYAERYRVFWAHAMINTLEFPRVALAIAPNDAGLAFHAANFYLGEEAHDVWRAEALYTKALALGYPEPVYVHFGLARAYFFQGRYNKALEAMHEALRLEPSFPNSYYMRGLIYGYKNSLTEAEQDFRRFLDLKPESWAGANDLAWIYFRQGRYEDIKILMAGALSYNPDNPWLHNSLGVALLNLGDKEGAKAALEKAYAGFTAMTPEEWGRAYPGNDSRYHRQGLRSTIQSVEKNIALLSEPSEGVIQ